MIDETTCCCNEKNLEYLSPDEASKLYVFRMKFCTCKIRILFVGSTKNLITRIIFKK